MKKSCLFVIVLLLVLTACQKNKDTDDDNSAGWTTEEQTSYNNVISLQDKAYENYTAWLQTMDSLEAISMLQQFFANDPLVSSAIIGDQGVAVQYTNGMRGGIFLNPQDDPGDQSINKGADPQVPAENLNEKSLVNINKMVFLNPHYWERVSYANSILQNYSTCLPKPGYSIKTYLNSDATVDRFTELAGYGAIHIYSHGWAWPEKINIQDVYLLTGEEISNDISSKYWKEIENGDIIVAETKVSSVRAASVYWISEKFIADQNDFSKDTVLFYGGFCYSILGNWDQLYKKFAKGAYFGFTWSVWTSRNANWSISLADSLCDTLARPLYDPEKWISGSNPPKSYFDPRAQKTVSIQYVGDAALTLWKSPATMVITNPVTNITRTTATASGKVTSDGGFPVTERGICLDINPNPTVSSGWSATSGSGIGAFEISLESLTPGAPYYVRAYAKNSNGISYGNQVTFTTLSDFLLTVTTDQVTDITQTTATSGGNVTVEGGGSVNQKGVCWSISPDPTIADSHTSEGGGPGAFTSSLTGLTLNTPYYVRAYASDNQTTIYGNQVSFSTPQFAIGQSYGGGVIFYLDGSGEHGLISSTSDQGIQVPWGCYLGNLSILIGGTSTSIGSGQANTTAIVNGCSEAGIAARICDDLVLNGFSDWFLPSQDELVQMKMYKNLIGGFSDSRTYWSSSEYTNHNAFAVPMANTGISALEKDNLLAVRAIRAF